MFYGERWEDAVHDVLVHVGVVSIVIDSGEEEAARRGKRCYGVFGYPCVERRVCSPEPE